MVLSLLAILYAGVILYAYMIGKYADRKIDEIERRYYAKKEEEARIARSSAKNKKG